MTRRFPWPLIAMWLAVAGFGAAALTGAMTGREGAFATTGTIEFWVLWTVTWFALLVPRTWTLTLARIGVPIAPVAAIATTVAGGPPTWALAFLVASLAATGILAHPAIIDAFLDGSSYGPEKRFGLRTPPLGALIAVPLTWTVAVSVCTIPLLFAAGLRIVAILILIAWAIGIRWAVRSLHLPSRRWVVFVPAGMVLVDPLMLTDALLFPRRNITAVGPAYAGTDATDLTGGAFGLTLQVDLTEDFEIPLHRGPNRPTETITTDRILFAVLRPGAMLEAAGRHRVQVGTTREEAPSCVEETQTAVPLPSTRSSR